MRPADPDDDEAGVEIDAGSGEAVDESAPLSPLTASRATSHAPSRVAGGSLSARLSNLRARSQAVIKQ